MTLVVTLLATVLAPRPAHADDIASVAAAALARVANDSFSEVTIDVPALAPMISAVNPSYPTVRFGSYRMGGQTTNLVEVASGRSTYCVAPILQPGRFTTRFQVYRASCSSISRSVTATTSALRVMAGAVQAAATTARLTAEAQERISSLDDLSRVLAKSYKQYKSRYRGEVLQVYAARNAKQYIDVTLMDGMVYAGDVPLLTTVESPYQQRPMGYDGTPVPVAAACAVALAPIRAYYSTFPTGMVITTTATNRLASLLVKARPVCGSEYGPWFRLEFTGWLTLPPA